MKEATHTGRLKDIRDIIKAKEGRVFSATMIEFILNNQCTELNFHIDERYYCESGSAGHYLGFIKKDLTDIREIKPVIEIPETPFWVAKEEGYGKARFIKGKRRKFFDVSHKEDWPILSTYDWSSNELKDNLNNGTWKICEAPEKDKKEELKNLIKNTLVAIDKLSSALGIEFEKENEK